MNKSTKRSSAKSVTPRSPLTRATTVPTVLPKTVVVPLEWFDELDTFLSETMARFEDPHGLPLLPGEQAQFIKATLWRVRKLTKTETWLRLQLLRSVGKMTELHA